MNEQPPRTRNQQSSLLSFSTKSLIAIAVLHTLAGLIRSHQVWSVILGVLIVSAPIFIGQAYSSTVGRIHQLQAFRDRGMIFHFLSGRILRLVFWLFWSVFAAYFLLVNFSTYRGWQWVPIMLAVPVFWVYYKAISRLVAREMKHYLVADLAIRGARWLATATLMLISFVLVWKFGPQGSFPTLANAIDAQENAIGEVAGSHLIYWTYQGLSLYEGAKIHLIGAGLSSDMLKALFTVLIGEGVIYYSICQMLSAVLIPGTELRRVFAPLSDLESPPQVPSLRIAFVTAAVTLLGLFVFFPGIAHLERMLSENPQLSSARQRGEPLSIKVERIGQLLYREGTHRQVEQLRATVAAANTLYQTKLRKDADSAFKIMELSVDNYLDWYYSLGGEYSRLAKMVTGELENHMKEKFKEHLQRNNPFQAFTETLNKGSATMGKDEYSQKLQAILDQNRVDLPLDQLTVIKQTSHESLLKAPAHFDVTTFEQRLGTTAVAGTLTTLVTGKVIAKAAGKGVLKLGAKAAMKMAASKAGGTLGGAAAGAASGAAIGSVVPIVGTAIGAAIGGFIGGLATGVAIDKGMIELEELLGREEFKAELMSAIGAAKSEFVKQLQPE